MGGGHLTLEWEIETVRNWFERLARRFFVVRYDARGSGLSQAEGVELSLAGYAGDIGAVASDAGLARYVLYANAAATAPAVLAILERPETISHFVLAGPQVDPSANADTAFLGQITSANWPYMRETMGTGIAAGASDEVAKQWSNVLDAASDGERYQRWMDQVAQWTVEQELPRVGTKTLVIGIDGIRYLPLSHAQWAARLIPDSRLVVLSAPNPAQGDPEPYARAIESFVFEDKDRSTEPLRGGFQTILFTDLEASTPLTQRLGDEAAQEILRGHNAIVRGALDEHGGREVKHTGDGIMASFPSAVAAVTAALQIQRELAGGEVRVRVGLNAGEPIAEDDDLFGLSVIEAARIADRAEPGLVLVSDVVRQLCEGKTFEFASLGAVSLKGFEESVELFEVRS